MSELRSVIAFFLGLVFFIVLIGLAIGRIRMPKKNQTAVAVTPTVIPTVTPTKKPGLWDKIAGIFRKKTTPTPTPTFTLKPQVTSTPLNEMKKALEPGQISGGSVVIDNQGNVTSIDRTGAVAGTSIPDTGAPTLLLPLALMFGGLGTRLRKKG